jgi:hypothetical protein
MKYWVTRGHFFVLFAGKILGKILRKFSPKNVGENWNFPRKKFQKIVSPRNSEENYAENHFPQKKMYEKSATDEFV